VSPTGRGEERLLSLEEMEKAHISHVIQVAGSVEEAASVLGISTTTLWRRRKKYDL
jgi:NtrC-family two-component system response regulator AlgB